MPAGDSDPSSDHEADLGERPHRRGDLCAALDARKRSAATITIRTLILWSKNDMRVTLEVGEALEKALRQASRPVQMEVYPSFDTDGPTLFSNAKGYPIYVPDAVSFLDAQLNR
jgi:dienelactone hydrolase